jgi:hypothetical protein
VTALLSFSGKRILFSSNLGNTNNYGNFALLDSESGALTDISTAVPQGRDGMVVVGLPAGLITFGGVTAHRQCVMPVVTGCVGNPPAPDCNKTDVGASFGDGVFLQL